MHVTAIDIQRRPTCSRSFVNGDIEGLLFYPLKIHSLHTKKEVFTNSARYHSPFEFTTSFIHRQPYTYISLLRDSSGTSSRFYLVQTSIYISDYVYI